MAGIIVKAKGAVADWKVGDQVCALVTGGGYAEYCKAPVEQLLRIPVGFSFEEAAALPEIKVTVQRVAEVDYLMALPDQHAFVAH